MWVHLGFHLPEPLKDLPLWVLWNQTSSYWYPPWRRFRPLIVRLITCSFCIFNKLAFVLLCNKNFLLVYGKILGIAPIFSETAKVCFFILKVHTLNSKHSPLSVHGFDQTVTLYVFDESPMHTVVLTGLSACGCLTLFFSLWSSRHAQWSLVWLSAVQQQQVSNQSFCDPEGLENHSGSLCCDCLFIPIASHLLQ